jgi:hypothetical protein
LIATYVLPHAAATPRNEYRTGGPACVQWSGGEAKEVEFPSQLSRASEHSIYLSPLFLPGQTNQFLLVTYISVLNSAFSVTASVRIQDDALLYDEKKKCSCQN